MRRWVNVMAAAVTVLAGVGATATAAQAGPIEPSPNMALSAETHSDSGWVPLPVPPFERAAGVVCDFAVKGVPIVSDIKLRTLTTYPDGTVHSELGVGPLIYQVTNESNGHQTELDGSASGIIVHNPDGSQKWYLNGPLGVAVPSGMGNLPRGLYQVDGPAYTLTISAAGYKTLNIRRGTVENICSRLA
jgi:hypothetical protein